MTMLPPEDRPPLAARVDAAMDEVAADQAAHALTYGGGLGILTWIFTGLHLAPAFALLAGFGVAALYFLAATRGRVPARVRPYLVAAALPVTLAVIWLS